MKLYIIEEWVPFPSSEYGGLVIVAATDDDEAERLCREIDGYESRAHAGRIASKVRAAKRFEVPSSTPPGVVVEFRT